MRYTWRNRSGFTLIELLIVVLILGALAAIAIPQFSDSGEDAKAAALDTSLAELRGAAELYYHHHGGVYPGLKKETDGTDVSTAGEAATAFVKQLTQYSSAAGVTSVTKDATYKYGPYIKRRVPENPFNDDAAVLCDIATTDITAATSDGTTGWKFYIKTGRLIANDGGHDSN
jgi:prepilin-type N-terminal cleavage/methylation domain-containing protein